VLPVIPPPANAVVHDQPATRWHDHLVRYIKDKGIHHSGTNTGEASRKNGSQRFVKSRNGGMIDQKFVNLNQAA
uniref:hypothetical protein n=1 Tax=Burkholderia ambifaria TaxID=152480 RepID=UPI001ABAC306